MLMAKVMNNVHLFYPFPKYESVWDHDRQIHCLCQDCRGTRALFAVFTMYTQHLIILDDVGSQAVVLTGSNHFENRKTVGAVNI